jgi:hypothetical protein
MSFMVNKKSKGNMRREADLISLLDINHSKSGHDELGKNPMGAAARLS